jgi:NADH dehydrogenase FAD-containing subunit
VLVVNIEAMGLEKLQLQDSESPSTSPEKEVDAVVIGAGFAGVYMLYKLRDRAWP